MSTGTPESWTTEALGTHWEITSSTGLDPSATAAIRAELDRIDITWSRFRSDSVVAEIARRAGHHPIPVTDQPLIDWYRTLYEVTGGAVTPTIGQTLVDAGYDAAYSLTSATTVRAAPGWDSVIAGHTGALDIVEPVLLDVGAAGKGFAVDRIATLLADHSGDLIVDGSGDMWISDRVEPVRVALEHPVDPTSAIGVVALPGGAICASAGNRRAWADWHHIVDARSASPAREVLATWAIAPSAMIADGIATALFFVDAPTLRTRLADRGIVFHHITVRRNGSVEHTDVPGLELFL
ncbi:FAD:protein FMN transferase [Gordonia soli]|uniref:FAD:protein FMN transferase n=1 Tax=Gordonia soli NBRC 108243 TaxID=1223545 RepID=M0QIH4_9ACTN|nr:FAD:protein FMN transferase [Gordonia soli]GAC68254.1 ApbE family protein [Gordonia soli NBRC 108243]